MADITFAGNLGDTPEIRFTPNGKAVATFNVAENHHRRQGNDFIEDGTTWWRVTAWEKQAETLAEYLKKGTRVLVTGTVKSRQWEDRDGQKRTSYDVTARQVAVIPKHAGQHHQPAPAETVDVDPWATA